MGLSIPFFTYAHHAHGCVSYLYMCPGNGAGRRVAFVCILSCEYM